MSVHPKKTTKLARNNKRVQRLVAVIVVIIIAAVGVYVLNASHAATPYVNNYAVNGTTSGTTSQVSGGSGSSGKAVQFGTVPTTGGGGGGGTTPSANGCTSGSTVAPCIGSATTAASGWGSPTFDDEFANDSSLNTQDWSSSYYNEGGSMNNVSTSASNVSFSGGALNLTLSSNSVGALISTNPNAGASKGFQLTYGYVEAEVYFPGNGSSIDNWPAFWITGQNWPADGESDIAEGLGTLTTNYHSNEGASNSGTISGTWSNAYHIYGINRTPGEDYIYWDGKLVRSYASDDGGSPQFIIFNVGSGNTSVTGSASNMKVKYVRVWAAS